MLLSEARPRPWRENNYFKRGFNQAETDKAAFDELKNDAQFAIDYKKNSEYGKYIKTSKAGFKWAAADKVKSEALPKLAEILQARLPKSSVGQYITEIEPQFGMNRIAIRLVNTEHSYAIDPKLKDYLPYKHISGGYTSGNYDDETGNLNIKCFDRTEYVELTPFENYGFLAYSLRDANITLKEFVQFDENQLEEFLMDYVYPRVKRAIKSEIESREEIDANLEVSDLQRRAGRLKSGKELEDWDEARLNSYAHRY